MPYLFFAVVYAVPFILNAVEGKEQITHNTFVWFFLSPANEPLWFLKTLFWVFVIYRISISGICRLGRGVGYTLLLAILTLCALCGKLLEVQSPLLLATGVPQAIVVLPLFAIGNMLAMKIHSVMSTAWNYKKSILLLSALSIWFFGAQSGVYLHIATYDATMCLFYLTSVSAFIALLLLFSWLTPVAPLLWLGRNSLYALGLHLTIIDILRICNVHERVYLLLLVIVLLEPLTRLVKRLFPFLSK